MARGPRKDDYLFSAEDDQWTEWILLLKGARAVPSMGEVRPDDSMRPQDKLPESLGSSRCNRPTVSDRRPL